MPTILVVDDEENIRHLYKAELEDEGYQVLTAGDGEEALEVFDSQDVHLMTIDIKMPKMDGLDLITNIRERDKELPIVVCSAYPSYKQDFHVWGAEAYVVKSADLSELKQRVKKLLKLPA